MERRTGGTPPKTRTLAINAWGLPGVGKSTFALTMPPPIYLLNCDRAVDSLLALLPPTHEIFYESFLLRPGEQLTQQSAQRFLAAFEGLEALAVQQGEGSFIIDGGARFWDVIKLAKLPPSAAESKDLKAWELPNDYWRSHLLGLEATPFQVCITHPAVTIWEGMTKESERLRPDAFKHQGYSLTVDVYIFTTGRPSDLYPKMVENMALTGQVPGETAHWGIIWRNKFNTKIEQRAVMNLTFPLLYQMTFGEPWTGAECWTP